MSTPFLVIDGYNLMHAAGMAPSTYGPGELEKRRHRFLKSLTGHLSSGQRSRTTVVFDAGDAPQGVSRRQVMDGIDVVFAPPGGDADTVIEEVIAAHSAPKQLRVVSSDHRLQKAARRRRAKFVDSEDFITELQRRSRRSRRTSRNSAATHPKYTGNTSAKETEHWLDVFGDIEVNDVPSAADLKDRPPSARERPNEIDTLQAEIDKLIEEADES